MIVDAELNSLLRQFVSVNKYNREGPCFYSASELDDIFERSVEDVSRFYTEFVNTTKGAGNS
jgi:molybdate-binding protein